MADIFRNARLKVKRAYSHIDTLIQDSSALPEDLYEITTRAVRTVAPLAKAFVRSYGFLSAIVGFRFVVLFREDIIQVATLLLKMIGREAPFSTAPFATRGLVEAISYTSQSTGDPEAINYRLEELFTQFGYRARRHKPKPLPPRHAAYKGEVARPVLATLPTTGRPCSTQGLTMHVIAERGMNTADKRLVKTVGKRVGACLRYHRTIGLIRSVKGLDDRTTWQIAPQP